MKCNVCGSEKFEFISEEIIKELMNMWSMRLKRWFIVKTPVRNLKKATSQEFIQKMDAFAETVTIISKNYFQDVHAVMVWLDIILETTRNKDKFAGYDFDKNWS